MSGKLFAQIVALLVVAAILYFGVQWVQEKRLEAQISKAEERAKKAQEEAFQQSVEAHIARCKDRPTRGNGC